MKTKVLLLSSVVVSFVLTQCSTPPGAGGAVKAGGISATKETPFVNTLGMKFVPVAGTKVLFCTTETTVGQYQAAGLGYQSPQFSQSSDHPAVNVSWDDAKAWCAWLSKKEGKRYRLPTDAEWSAAVWGSSYPWGNSWPPPNHAGNYAGQEMRGCTAGEREILFKGFTLIGGFSDRHKFTAPVGSYAANGYGLHDLGGNVWEWCEDRHPDVSSCRVLRGGSWILDGRELLASSSRNYNSPDYRDNYNGFRCVVVR